MPESLLSVLQDPGNLTVVFQPIFELVDRPDPIHALEATVRGPRGTHFESEDLLLDYVHRKKAESIIDRECVSLVCSAMQTLPADIRIHVNVHLATLTQNPGFIGFFEHRIKDSGLDITRFTVEFIDGEVDSAGLYAEGTDAFRRLGVRIGLNNVGMANSTWRLLVERPVDYWKLAPYLAQATSIDAKRRAAVESILALAKKLGGLVVSEGVTSEDNLAALAMMGVELVQTELLCRPISVEHLMRSGVLNGATTDPGSRPASSANGKHNVMS